MYIHTYTHTHNTTTQALLKHLQPPAHRPTPHTSRPKHATSKTLLNIAHPSEQLKLSYVIITARQCHSTHFVIIVCAIVVSSVQSSTNHARKHKLTYINSVQQQHRGKHGIEIPAKNNTIHAAIWTQHKHLCTDESYQHFTAAVPSEIIQNAAHRRSANSTRLFTYTHTGINSTWLLFFYDADKCSDNLLVVGLTACAHTGLGTQFKSLSPSSGFIIWAGKCVSRSIIVIACTHTGFNTQLDGTRKCSRDHILIDTIIIIVTCTHTCFFPAQYIRAGKRTINIIIVTCTHTGFNTKRINAPGATNCRNNVLIIIRTYSGDNTYYTIAANSNDLPFAT
jgi:hypothetical protein